MEALCHQPFGLGRQPSGCCVRLLVLGTTRFHYASRIGEADTERAFVAFLASLGWRPSAAPTHYLDTLLADGNRYLMPIVVVWRPCWICCSSRPRCSWPAPCAPSAGGTTASTATSWWPR